MTTSTMVELWLTRRGMSRQTSFIQSFLIQIYNTQLVSQLILCIKHNFFYKFQLGTTTKIISYRFTLLLDNIIMSIYSGFATRFQQQAYDHCIDSLLYVLQKRIIKFYQGEQADEEKFISVVLKLHQQMRNMEKNKYLDPKSSQSITELIKFMQIYEQNIVLGSQKEQSIEPGIEYKQQSQPLKVEQEEAPEKKKVSLWVQKVAKVEQNGLEQQNPTSLDWAKDNKKQEDAKLKQEQLQFKRTSATNPLIYAVNPKVSSRTNLSRDKQPSAITTKQDKNRSVSGLLYQKQTTVYSKASFKHPVAGQSSNITRKRKIKSINKSVNQLENQLQGTRNEVSDIIREYIIKTKRSRVLSRNSKHQLEYLGKLNDF